MYSSHGSASASLNSADLTFANAAEAELHRWTKTNDADGYLADVEFHEIKIQKSGRKKIRKAKRMANRKKWVQKLEQQRAAETNCNFISDYSSSNEEDESKKNPSHDESGIAATASSPPTIPWKSSQLGGAYYLQSKFKVTQSDQIKDECPKCGEKFRYRPKVPNQESPYDMEVYKKTRCYICGYEYTYISAVYMAE